PVAVELIVTFFGPGPADQVPVEPSPTRMMPPPTTAGSGGAHELPKCSSRPSHGAGVSPVAVRFWLIGPPTWGTADHLTTPSSSGLVGTVLLQSRKKFSVVTSLFAASTTTSAAAGTATTSAASTPARI